MTRPTTGQEIRKAFLDFFARKGHQVVPSSSLIPEGDPTLLFTSAGMVQFKPYFSGQETPTRRRLASCQKCFRTTDIDSVGDESHLTFFEMLGNFSIGDYFKEGAIELAWEFVTKGLGLSSDRLWITIYLDDDEAQGLWMKIGVPEARVLRFGKSENWWGPAGETGPCGPDSEIFYDRGEEHGCGHPDCAPNCPYCDRYLELWNLVFMQYHQDEAGELTPLPEQNIDTGMGLERTAVVMQEASSIYEADLFYPLVKRAGELVGVEYGSHEASDRSLRIIAEHGRAATFLITDGVMPANEGRGYVLRRILRKAIYHGRHLGREEPFLGEIAGVVSDLMGEAYPELIDRAEFVVQVMTAEEERFQQTLEAAIQHLQTEAIMARKSIVQSITDLAAALPTRQLEALRKAYEEPVTRAQELIERGELVEQLEALRKAYEEPVTRWQELAARMQQEIVERGELVEQLEAFRKTYEEPVTRWQELAARMQQEIVERGELVDQLEAFRKAYEEPVTRAQELAARMQQEIVERGLVDQLEAFRKAYEEPTRGIQEQVRAMQTALVAPFDDWHEQIQQLRRNFGVPSAELEREVQKLKEELAERSSQWSEDIEELKVGLDDIVGKLQTIEKTLMALSSKAKIIPGDQVFRLYDTYGLPPDFTREIAAEHGLATDQERFEEAMAEQQERARAAARFVLGSQNEIYQTLELPATEFLGYEGLKASSRVLALLQGGEAVDGVQAGDEVQVVLDITPFHAEAGGQVADTGVLIGSDGRIRVEDTQSPLAGLIVHYGSVEQGRVGVDDTVEAVVDEGRRLDIMRNHTATHLLHKALREVLGDHARQSGSLVAPDRLRFDFTHMAALSPEELREIEQWVNARVRENLPVTAQMMDYDKAIAAGAVAIFGEKYGDRVRMVSIDDYTKELCGGTHLRATGEIGLFHIVDEESIGAGLRRIEALTGRGAERCIQEALTTLVEVADRLQAQPGDVGDKVASLLESLKEKEREVARLRREKARSEVDSLLEKVTEVKGVKVLAAEVRADDIESLREMTDWVRDRLGSGAILLGANIEGKNAFVAVVSPDLTEKGIRADEIVKEVAGVAGGSGGGRARLAEGGGGDPSKLKEAVNHTATVVSRLLKL